MNGKGIRGPSTIRRINTFNYTKVAFIDTVMCDVRVPEMEKCYGVCIKVITMKDT